MHQNSLRPALRLGPRTPLGKLATHAQTPQLVERGGKPLSENLGPWLSHLGFEFRSFGSFLAPAPRPRNVDFAPTPLLPSGTVWVNGCKPLVGQISWLNAIAGVAELLLSVIHVTQYACHVHEVTAVAFRVQRSIFSIMKISYSHRAGQTTGPCSHHVGDCLDQWAGLSACSMAGCAGGANLLVRLRLKSIWVWTAVVSLQRYWVNWRRRISCRPIESI